MAKLYDPTAAPTAHKTPLAPRVADLNGKVIGMLDISKPKGIHFLDSVGTNRHPVLPNMPDDTP